MNIKTIEEDMKTAMKNGEKFELTVLRMLKSALQNEAISKNKELDEAEVISVIKKQVKVRKDSKSEYEKYNRQDLVESLDKEINILSKYLPEEMSDEEVMKVIDEVFNELKPESMKDMGKVMAKLNTLIAAKADMSKVSLMVKEKLNS